MSEPGDPLTEAGARKLAARLNEYWLKRGIDPGVEVVQVREDMLEGKALHGGAFWVVRSNLGAHLVGAKNAKRRILDT